MARNPSKILSAAEAKVSELRSKMSAQLKVVEKARKLLDKEVAALDKLEERVAKQEAKKPAGVASQIDKAPS